MLLDLATVLDPRFKVDYISASDLAAVNQRIIVEARSKCLAEATVTRRFW